MISFTQFSNLLLDWHSQHDRNLPWKNERNVFHIWLSEIILQQTRVSQGLPYYYKFINRFKNVFELAKASEDEVMKLWEGLGYYSRARNLHSVAKTIAKNGGKFPETYKELLELKGVGPYTAAAIASFAYDLPHPVIDGNVNRVISRIFGVTEPVDTKAGRKNIERLAHKMLNKKLPAAYNQAIMDFGSLQCTPGIPDCHNCPFQKYCYAFNNEMVADLPYKSKSIVKKKRSLHYIILNQNGKYIIRKRIEKGIWRSLYEFILIEKEKITPKLLQSKIQETGKALGLKHVSSSEILTHELTHQKLFVQFHNFNVERLELSKGSDYILVDQKNLRKFAYPKIIDWYLNNNSIYLEE